MGREFRKDGKPLRFSSLPRDRNSEMLTPNVGFKEITDDRRQGSGTNPHSLTLFDAKA